MSATKVRVLHVASDMAGGSGPLAERLGISEGMLRKYVAGVFPLPDSLFLRAVDLILMEREPHPAHGSAAGASLREEHRGD